jgi:hypothetical protein
MKRAVAGTLRSNASVVEAQRQAAVRGRTEDVLRAACQAALMQVSARLNRRPLPYTDETLWRILSEAVRQR